jgi:Na+-translocating ferredoxin:NAD+ oxidoreductase RnfA subunit
MRVNLASAIYGTITVGSVLAIESAGRETYAKTIAATALAVLVLWLAHAYAENTSSRIEEAEPLSLGAVLATMSHELSILVGAGVPVLAVLIAWALAAPLATAVNAGIWTSVGTVVVLEIVAALRARLEGRDFAAQVVLGAAFGLGTLGLKLILH